MKSPNWNEFAREYCAQHSISPEKIETLCTWDERGCANTVYRVDDDSYLKVFGPTAEWQFHVERLLLTMLAEQSDIPAPRLLHEGHLDDGYPYLFLAEIGGFTAEKIWESLSRLDQLRVARDLGKITKAIHELPRKDLHNIEDRFGGMREHNKRYRDWHVTAIRDSHSIPLSQREELIHFIDEEAPKHLGARKVVTHFDLAHNHIYLNGNSGSVAITGIIDWAEATLGPAEWDLSYLWFWTFSGDREAMQECLAAYFGTDAPPPHFARRCLAAIFYTSSMSLLWPKFLEDGPVSENIVTDLTQSLFPVELFGGAA
jgi:hygromycin-B 7''-O-kinase